MATVRTLIGYIKGPKGDTGATGATGAQGPAGNDGAPGVTDYASTSAAGLVRVGDDFNINSSNGVLSVKNSFTQASSLANISSGESQATILGKISKFFATLMPSTFVKNNVTSTDTDKALSANMGKTLAGDLATVQTSATASKSYAVGEYLVYNGQLYNVTSAIASGASITGHISATNAGAQIKTLNDSLNATGSWTSSTLKTTSVQNGGGISTVVDSITVEGGVYLIIALAKFDTNANGLRMVSIAQDSTALDSLWFISGSAAPTGSTSMQMIRFTNTTEGTHTFNLVVRHTGGSDLNVTTRMFAVCIRNKP